jgi:multiple sugar transport system permease protein
VAGESPTSRIAQSWSTFGRRIPKLYAWATILPVLILVAAFTLYPFGFAASMSVRKYILTQPNSHPFVGLRNFTQVIGDELFLVSAKNTLTFTLLSVPLVTLLGLSVALLLNNRLPGFGVLRALVLLPWAIPLVSAGIIWKLLLHGQFGALSGLLFQLGLIEQYIPWLSDTKLAMLSVVFAHLWREFPLPAILFLAGLQNISPELYDAAKVDGAGVWARFWSVTFPLLRAPLLVVVIYETMIGVAVFDLVYVLTGGGPGSATTLISWFAYTATFKFLNLGQGAALSFIIALILAVLIVVYLRVLPTEEAAQ